MQYLHTMVRVADIDKSLAFYCGLLGLKEMSRQENEKGRFTLVFLAAPGDEDLARERKGPMVELTYNWDPENYTGGRQFVHLRHHLEDNHPTCHKLIGCRVHILLAPPHRHNVLWRPPCSHFLQAVQCGA